MHPTTQNSHPAASKVASKETSYDLVVIGSGGAETFWGSRGTPGPMLAALTGPAAQIAADLALAL